MSTATATTENGPAYGPARLATVSEWTRNVARARQTALSRVEPIRLQLRLTTPVGSTPTRVEGLAAASAPSAALAIAGA